MDEGLIKRAKAVMDRANKLGCTETKLRGILLTGDEDAFLCTGSAILPSSAIIPNWGELDWLLRDLIRYVESYCDMLEEDIKELEKKVQALPKNDADQEQDKE